ncbi:MAG: cytochrome c biogenesis protein [Desulfovibrio sp.]|jgi:ABC-type uncharacterized transport system permease subunit|nr:cytochrome c biogenesis protein [Desulfovibrio sp.]
MDYERMLSVGVILLYTLGAFGILMGALSVRPSLRKAAERLTLAGFALHSASLLCAFAGVRHNDFSAGLNVQFLAWCVIVLYLAARYKLRYPFLGMTAAPLALLLYMLSMRLAGVKNILPDHLSGLFFGLHIWSLYLSFGLLAMAFGAGVVFIYAESRIKKKMAPSRFTLDMPSLAGCDRINRAAVTAGFPLFTLGITAGFVWAPVLRTAAENPKVLLSLFIWFLYALLFYQRAALGYRGRKTAVMAIAIFAVSVLSLLADHLLSHHSTWLVKISLSALRIGPV